jgi:hypothetical protein
MLKFMVHVVTTGFKGLRIETESEREKIKWREVMRVTTFKGGNNFFFIISGFQAVCTRPSGRGMFERG